MLLTYYRGNETFASSNDSGIGHCLAFQRQISRFIKNAICGGFLVVFLCSFSLRSFAEGFVAFVPHATYQVCFTPGGQCTAAIVKVIDDAKQQILVQAFNFTSKKIAHALVRAKRRGVEVKILLDKSIVDNDFMLTFIKLHHLWFKIDVLPVVAHNKVMVVDNHMVITGSFNFTVAAETSNAENVLIIDDYNLAQQYAKNWYQREKKAIND